MVTANVNKFKHCLNMVLETVVICLGVISVFLPPTPVNLAVLVFFLAWAAFKWLKFVYYIRKSKGVKRMERTGSFSLLPCPFCGELPTLKKRGEQFVFIVCPEGSICRGSGAVMALDLDIIEAGVKLYNTRA